MTVRIRIREKSASHDGSVFGGVGRAGDMGQISVGGSRIGTTGLCRHTRVFCCSNAICTLQPVPPCNVWGLVVSKCSKVSMRLVSIDTQ